MRSLSVLTAAAILLSGCGGGTRVRITSGEDRREAIDADLQKSGVLLAPLVDAADAPSGGARASCLEEANGAVERSLRLRYQVKSLLPNADDATGAWGKLPAAAKDANGGRYLVHVERATCGAAAEVEVAVWEREEGKEMVRIVGEAAKEGAAGARAAGGAAATKLFHGL